MSSANYHCDFSDISGDELVSATQLIEGCVSDECWNDGSNEQLWIASDAVRSYKRVSEKKIENLMDVVTCKSLKCDAAKAVSSASCSPSQSVSGASVVSDGPRCTSVCF